ncbi:S41 family peptidase [Chitinophaga sp. Hz27]|uniref:S41 family peptidase n=1 Tax=Chitinophaga sp. Hz27 TaxID=3347169 RepID=UPI0035DA9DB8
MRITPHKQMLLSLIITVLSCFTGNAQQNSKTVKTPQLLAIADMKQDLAVLWKAVSNLHPTYGIYTPPDSLYNIYNTTLHSITKPLSENEFIAAVYPFISALKCGHTQLRNSAGYQPTAADILPKLPFQVLVQDTQVWITTTQAQGIHTGDEIISINNIKVPAIIKHGGDLYAADGNNRTFKELFLSEYDGFEDACNKYYHWQPPYHIVLKTTGGVLKTITTAALTTVKTAEIDNYKDWNTSSNTGYLPLRFLKNTSIACFEVHSYQYEDTVLFQKAFQEIHTKGIRNLIIDLRHNTGGDIRIAAKLLSYLAAQPFQMVGDLWARVPDPGNTAFNPYFDSTKTLSYQESFKPLGIKKEGHYKMAFQSGFVDLLRKSALDADDHYNGRLVVLIDGATFSSGAHTAAAIRQYCPEATFIGRETAGGSEGCSGGTIQYLTLPHTRIVVEFPLLRVVSVLKHPTYGHGILPDKAVHYTPMDIVTKRDVDLEEAVRVINAQN